MMVIAVAVDVAFVTTVVVGVVVAVTAPPL